MGATRKGHGRYDIMLTPRNQQDPGILIEFKKAKNKKELAGAAKKALEQIKSKSYVMEMRNAGYHGPIFCYGIAAVPGKYVTVVIEMVNTIDFAV